MHNDSKALPRRRLWLALSAMLVVVAAGLLLTGHRTFNNWLMLVSTFAVFMSFWSLRKPRAG